MRSLVYNPVFYILLSQDVRWETYAFGFFWRGVCGHAHVCDYQYVGTDTETLKSESIDHSYQETEGVFRPPTYGTCLEREFLLEKNSNNFNNFQNSNKREENQANGLI